MIVSKNNHCVCELCEIIKVRLEKYSSYFTLGEWVIETKWLIYATFVGEVALYIEVDIRSDLVCN